MLENIRIASPCSADWNQMRGDDRVRHCEACNLNVYNLAAFTEKEIRELVTNRNGRLCGRIFRRRDGTVLTQNCPVGLKAVSRRISKIAGAVFTFLVPVFGIAAHTFAQTYTRMNVSTAAIDLEVVDPTGAPVPEAKVILEDPSRKQTFQGKTNEHGRFALLSAQNGHYQLTISAPGLSALQSVELRAGEMLSLPVTLHYALMGDVLEVYPGSQPDRDTVPLNLAPPPSIPRPHRL